MLESRQTVPIYHSDLSNLITEIVDSPLPFEFKGTSNSNNANEQSLSCKVLIISFSGVHGQIDRPPVVDSIRQIVRFNNISIVDINIGEQLYGVYSILLSLIHGDLKFQKILLYDFLQLFKFGEEDLLIPLQCFNFRFLINILNLILLYGNLVHLIESELLFDRCLIPISPYTDIVTLKSDWLKSLLLENKRDTSGFINLQDLLLNLGYNTIEIISSKDPSTPSLFEEPPMF